jgi:hypothetical protein
MHSMLLHGTTDLLPSIFCKTNEGDWCVLRTRAWLRGNEIELGGLIFVSLCIRFVWTGNARRKLQHSNYRRTEDILVNGHLPTKLHFLIDSIKWFYIIRCTCFVVRFYHIQSFVKWNNQYNFVSFRLRILETACRVITYYVTILMKTVTNTQHDKTVLFQDILCIP